nr:hypothetical protein Iba_chr10cCG9390 [Ipomoea batatas]
MEIRLVLRTAFRVSLPRINLDDWEEEEVVDRMVPGDILTIWSHQDHHFVSLVFHHSDDDASTKLSSLDPSDNVNFSLLLLVKDATNFSSFSTSDSGLCVFGSIPFCLSFFLIDEFQRFLISLSVLPGSLAAI